MGRANGLLDKKPMFESLGMDTMFTPQLIVQGTTHLDGTDQDALLKAIKAADRFPPLSLQVRNFSISVKSNNSSLLTLCKKIIMVHRYLTINKAQRVELAVILYS